MIPVRSATLMLLAIVTTAAFSARAEAPDLSKENAELKAKVDALQKENAELKRKLQAAEARTPELHFAPADADVAKRYFDNLNGNLIVPAPAQPPQQVPSRPAMPPGTATHPFNGVNYYVIPCDAERATRAAR